MKPTRRLIALLILWCVMALVISLLPLLSPRSVKGTEFIHAGLSSAWQAAGILLLLLALWDAFRRDHEAAVTIERLVQGNLAVGVWHDVRLRICHEFDRLRTISIFDHYPDHADYQNLPQPISLIPNRFSICRYRVRPMMRGNATFHPAYVLLPSPLGFWNFRRFVGKSTTVKVFPDFAAIGHLRLLATDNLTSQMGIKLKQRRGEGLEFHQLREYQENDDIRRIDWKATARKRKLIAKDYQDERDQQIILMLDCGRRMRPKDGQLSHFDHALNATLLLGYVALRQGDAVGVMSFSGQKRWLPPQKGMTTINGISRALYDLHSTTEASDYSLAAQELMRLQRKRSLVILLSNVHDENSDDLAAALKLLQKKHLVVLANVRESVLDHIMTEAITSFDQAIRYAGTLDYLVTRKRIRDNFVKQGMLCLDTTPQKLPIELVNQYLGIKGSGKL